MANLAPQTSCEVPADWTADFSQCLYEWQGLGAGSFAILAAVIGYLAIRKQIEHSKDVEVRKVTRVFEGRRATLSLVLSSATVYTEAVIRSLAEARLILNGAGNQSLTGQWSPPVFPNDIPTELRQFIEASDRADANKLVLELLSQLQILRSRLTSLVTEEDVYRIGIRRNLAEYQIHAAKVRQICGALFPFARGDDKSLPQELGRDEPIHSLQFIDHNAEDDADFVAMRDIFLAVERPWWPR